MLFIIPNKVSTDNLRGCSKACLYKYLSESDFPLQAFAADQDHSVEFMCSCEWLQGSKIKSKAMRDFRANGYLNPMKDSHEENVHEQVAMCEILAADGDGYPAGASMIA